MFTSGYFEFEALNKYSRAAGEKAPICAELKRKFVVVPIVFGVIGVQL